jgi:hypothetical protein
MDNSHIYGIFFDCPSKERCEDCIVGEVLHLTHHVRIRWFERQDESKKTDIIVHHMNCTRKRK